MGREATLIDGSQGEGGGQILRTALSLACLAGRTVRIIRIRANRPKPGLRPQHLTAVKALKEVTQAQVQGDQIGSQELTFSPGPVVAGNYVFDVGTAGSVGLIFQAIFPVLSLAPSDSSLVLIGGTHVPFSPSVTYLETVFLPAVEPLGFQGRITLKRWGWYPKGAGQMEVKINPRRPGPWPCLHLQEPGDLQQIRGLSVVGNLPRTIALRQKEAALRRLASSRLKAEIDLLECPSLSPGTFFLLVEDFERIRAGFSALGERGKPAEQLGEEVASEALAFLESGKGMDPRLADQILLYLALTPGEHRFTTSSVTPHLVTHLDILQQIQGILFQLEGQVGHPGEIYLRVG